MSATTISSGTSKASIKTLSFRFSRVEYSTKTLASLSKRASCIGRYDSIPGAGCNRSARRLSDATKSRGECAVKVIDKWDGAALFFQLQGRHLPKQFLNNVLVFFSFKAARAVDENSVGLQQRQNCPDHLDLSPLHPNKS